jgi:hypothetical protein
MDVEIGKSPHSGFETTQKNISPPDISGGGINTAISREKPILLFRFLFRFLRRLFNLPA